MKKKNILEPKLDFGLHNLMNLSQKDYLLDLFSNLNRKVFDGIDLGQTDKLSVVVTHSFQTIIDNMKNKITNSELENGFYSSLNELANKFKLWHVFKKNKDQSLLPILQKTLSELSFFITLCKNNKDGYIKYLQNELMLS